MNVNNPFYSVIIPARNSEAYIRKMLDSIKEQTFTDYELIVVCDSCTDNTAAIAREYTDLVYETDCGNDGLARNIGLEHATGEWVLFADDDDWWMHEFAFEMLSNVIRHANECDAVFFSLIKRTVGYIRQHERYCDPLTAGHCWKRSFIGDTRFPASAYGSDNAFFYHMLRKEPEVVFWDNPLYYYNYMREGSLSDRHEKGEI